MYIIFALATTIVCIFTFIRPIMLRLREDGKGTDITGNTFLVYITFTVMFFLTAPITFLIYVNPYWSDSFKNTLYDSLAAQA